MLLTQIPIFVYGTLRSDGPNAHLIKPYTTVCRRAEVRGALHYVDYVDDQDAPGRTVTYSPEGDSRVEGELLTWAPHCSLSTLAQLDSKELNFGRQGPPPCGSRCVFVRQLILVTSDDEAPLMAWTYVLASAREGLGPRVQAGTDGIVRYTRPQRASSRHGAHVALEGFA